MPKNKTTIKAAWIAAAAAIVAALVTQIPALFKDSSPTESISIENVQDSSIITGDNNSIKNEKK